MNKYTTIEMMTSTIHITDLKIHDALFIARPTTIQLLILQIINFSKLLFVMIEINV